MCRDDVYTKESVQCRAEIHRGPASTNASTILTSNQQQKTDPGFQQDWGVCQQILLLFYFS